MGISKDAKIEEIEINMDEEDEEENKEEPPTLTRNPAADADEAEAEP